MKPQHVYPIATIGTTISAILLVISLIHGGYPQIFGCIFAIIAFQIWKVFGRVWIRKQQKGNQDSYIQSHKIKVSIDCEVDSDFDSDCVHNRFIVDKANKKLYLNNRDGNLRMIPFAEVTDAAVIIDKNQAFVDVTVWNTVTIPKVSSYGVVIYRNNMNTPQTKLDLITSEISTSDSNFAEIKKFAEEVYSTAKAIAAQNAKNDQNTNVDKITTTIKEVKTTSIEKPSEKSVPEAPAQNQNDIANKLKELNNLKENGLITEEEYNTARSKVLSRI